MTYAEIKTMVEGIGLPCAYHHFAEGESPDPPFLIFLLPETENFSADDRVYSKISILHIELYTDEKDPQLEETVEEALEEADMFWDKVESWIASEKMYEVLYEMRVIYGE